jgi:hypothetical protein
MASQMVPFGKDLDQSIDAIDILVAQNDDDFCHDLLYLTRLMKQAATTATLVARLQAHQRAIALMAVTHARQYDPTVVLSVDAIRAAYRWMTYRGVRVPAPALPHLDEVLASLAQEGLLVRTATGRWQRAPLPPQARMPRAQTRPEPRRRRQR